MNRTRLFYGSLLVYGAVTVLSRATGADLAALSIPSIVGLLAGLAIAVVGLHGLWRPPADERVSDSWLAYLMAVGAALVTVGYLVDLA